MVGKLQNVCESWSMGVHVIKELEVCYIGWISHNRPFGSSENVMLGSDWVRLVFRVRKDEA